MQYKRGEKMENSTVLKFEISKTQAEQTLSKLENFLTTGKQLGVDIDKKIIHKFETAKNNTTNRKLRIALIGGFSEGKTSIAAAWLGKIDKSTMKIRAEESSDDIVVYDFSNNIEIIDTPGLFGFKEKSSGEKYKDITQKYISEADIILYVMNPSNPIKESHKNKLVWLFRTLNLLPRTVFVLSKFDDEVDISDESAYKSRLEIKKQNIVDSLTDWISLSKAEIYDIAIVAVSANPYDKGVEYWLQKQKEYKTLSHISQLQDATDKKIFNNGGIVEVVKQTQKSIMRDIVDTSLPIAQEKFEEVKNVCVKMEEMNSSVSKELNSLYENIKDSRANLRKNIIEYFSDLILQTKGLSLETVEEFFEREIGNKGIIIEQKIRGFFDQYVSSINLKINKLTITYKEETSHFLDLMNKFGVKDFINNVGSQITNTTILATRDFLNLPIKFAPWGAVNLAGKISGFLAIVGISLELWDSWKKYEKELKFKESQKEMVENFEKQREDLLEIINGEDFIKQFFESYFVLKNNIEKLNEKMNKEKERYQKFNDWKNECNVIEAEVIV